MSSADFLRLVAVPIFAMSAWRDYRTRRVPGHYWYPLYGLGLILILWETVTVSPSERSLYLIRVAISLGFIIPLSYGFWYFGLFGAADRKAFIALAIVFPIFPTFAIGSLEFPIVETIVGVFSLTILTDAVLVGITYPFLTAIRNAIKGHFAPVMFLAYPVTWDELPTAHGKLFETPSGFTHNGLDLDALRMYLRWRDLTLEELRENPEEYRDPASLPENPHPPTDGAVMRTDGGLDDPWGASVFAEEIGTPYGTTPTKLRAGIEILTDQNQVWISPGIPFLVPVFIGLLVALTYGDLLFTLLTALGLT